MKADHFEQALRDFRSRQPFEPFYIELTSGKIIRILHPEALASQNGQAAHVATDAAVTIFDHEGLARLFYEKREVAESNS